MDSIIWRSLVTCYVYFKLSFRLQISECSSKILLSIYLSKSSTPMLTASPGKGNTTSKPRQSFNKSFSKEKVGDFPKTPSFRYIDYHFKFCHDITLIIKCDWEIM
jgi:hypothetical protein